MKGQSKFKTFIDFRSKIVAGDMQFHRKLMHGIKPCCSKIGLVLFLLKMQEINHLNSEMFGNDDRGEVAPDDHCGSDNYYIITLAIAVAATTMTASLLKMTVAATIMAGSSPTMTVVRMTMVALLLVIAVATTTMAVTLLATAAAKTP